MDKKETLLLLQKFSYFNLKVQDARMGFLDLVDGQVSHSRRGQIRELSQIFLQLSEGFRGASVALEEKPPYSFPLNQATIEKYIDIADRILQALPREPQQNLNGEASNFPPTR